MDQDNSVDIAMAKDSSLMDKLPDELVLKIIKLAIESNEPEVTTGDMIRFIRIPSHDFLLNTIARGAIQ